MATFNIPIIDYSGESSTTSVRVADAETDLNLTAVFDAVSGVSLGNAGVSSLNTATPKDNGSGVAPSNKFAQREMKWLVRFVDNVNGKKGRLEIPAADANLLTGNTDYMDLTVGAGAALKSALDAHALSQDGNAITVSTVEFVGRNS